MTELSIDQLTPQQLTELKKKLKEQEQAQKAAQAARKKAYEQKRDTMVSAMIVEAVEMHIMLADFKARCIARFEEFREIAKEYSDIRSDSKGGFSLRTADGVYLARLDRNVVYEYDERADQAITLIEDFLADKIKKRDAKTYRLVSSLLSKNKSGDLNPAKVAHLLKIRDNYQDERWLKAMELLNESFREREVSYNMSFFKKDNSGKDQPINLSFANL
jgi:hypothetical protein